MCEVKTQPIGSHERALLLNVRAEHLAQRCVQQVCRGVVKRGGTAPLAVYMSTERIAGADLALLHAADMRMRGAALLGVMHDKAHACGRELAGVTHLSTRLRIERRAIEDD